MTAPSTAALAARYVARRVRERHGLDADQQQFPATVVAECAELLAMLGLLAPADGVRVPSVAALRATDPNSPTGPPRRA